MNDNLSEMPILLCCLWAGTLLGIIYDALRLMRVSGKKLTVIAADILFGLFFFAVVSVVLFYADNGKIRVHYIITVFLAILLWVNYPGKIIRSMLSAIVGKIHDKRGSKKV